MSTWEELESGWGSWWIPWNGIREEIERELRARILIVGPRGAGKSTLLNRLKGWPVSPVNGQPGPHGDIEDYGLFVLMDLPEHAEEWMAWGELAGSSAPDVASWDLVLFVIDGTTKLSGEVYRWLARFRWSGRPVVLILNYADRLGSAKEKVRWELESQSGVQTFALSARFDEDLPSILVPLLLRANPQLAIALGREFPAFRSRILREITRSAAAFSALAGSVPVPFLDFPAQAAVQLRLVMSIAALYDRLPAGGLSWEGFILVLISLSLRYGVQWIARRLPLIGRGSAALMGGLGTWALSYMASWYFAGSAAVHEAGPRIAIPLWISWIARALKR